MLFMFHPISRHNIWEGKTLYMTLVDLNIAHGYERSMLTYALSLAKLETT